MKMKVFIDKHKCTKMCFYLFFFHTITYLFIKKKIFLFLDCYYFWFNQLQSRRRNGDEIYMVEEEYKINNYYYYKSLSVYFILNFSAHKQNKNFNNTFSQAKKIKD